jgi:queuosine precursor transporter
VKLQKPQKLWTILAGFFIANALLAEFLGVKIFSLEKTFGFNPSDIKLGDSNFNFDLTAGVIIWPAVFIITDIINDFYGKKAVKFLSYLAAGILAFSFLVVTLVIKSIGLVISRAFLISTELIMQSLVRVSG